MRYLRKTGTDELFVYTPLLAQREDMELVDVAPKEVQSIEMTPLAPAPPPEAELKTRKAKSEQVERMRRITMVVALTPKEDLDADGYPDMKEVSSVLGFDATKDEVERAVKTLKRSR